MIDATVASDNPLRLRKNLLKIMSKIVMAIDDNIRDEKLQYNINREAAKISALSTGKIAKYEPLTGEEILSFNRSQIIEQANILSFSKSFWKVKGETSWCFKVSKSF